MAAPALLDCWVCKGVHKVVHFLFGADIVGFVENRLLLGFGHFGIGVHRRLIHSQCHTKADRDFIEIHNFSPFCSTGCSFVSVGADAYIRPLCCRI